MCIHCPLGVAPSRHQLLCPAEVHSPMVAKRQHAQLLRHLFHCNVEMCPEKSHWTNVFGAEFHWYSRLPASEWLAVVAKERKRLLHAGQVVLEHVTRIE